VVSDTSDASLANVIHKCFEQGQTHDEPVALLIEQPPGVELALPSFDGWRQLVDTLNDHAHTIESRLLGTCVQTGKLEGLAEFGRTLFLAAYRPKQPFTMTESREDTDSFLSTLACASECA
jgi:hypothetical protein